MRLTECKNSIIEWYLRYRKAARHSWRRAAFLFVTQDSRSRKPRLFAMLHMLALLLPRNKNDTNCNIRDSRQKRNHLLLQAKNKPGLYTNTNKTGHDGTHPASRFSIGINTNKPGRHFLPAPPPGKRGYSGTPLLPGPTGQGTGP